MSTRKSRKQPARRATPKPAARHPTAAQTEAERTRATQLHLAGNAPAAVANIMRIPERTARHHIQKTRQDFAADYHAERDTMMVRAIESQRAIAAAAFAAFAAFEEERDRERAILAGQFDHTTRRVVHRGRPPRDHQPDNPDTPRDTVEEIVRPRLPNQSARFLTLAINAQREAAKLQGLYEPQPQQNAGPEHLLLTDDIDPETGEHIIVPFAEKYPLTPPKHADDEMPDLTQNPATESHTPTSENPRNPKIRQPKRAAAHPPSATEAPNRPHATPPVPPPPCLPLPPA